MKIKQLFKRAAATVMAAVTVLSLLPATAFAATGDVGTISFTHTYDSAGNVMYYNSSAVINGYTAGGAGKNKFRMYVDGSTAFCIQPGVPLKTGNQLIRNSSETWNALSASQKKAVGLALLYGYQGNRDSLTGSDDEKWLATQTLVWEFVTGCRNASGSFRQTDSTVYSLHFGSNYPNSGAAAAYDQIVSMLTRHNTVPSFMNGSSRELEYKDGKYMLTLTDTNGVLSEYSISSSDRNVSVSKSNNTLTISSTEPFKGSVRITATRNNIPVVSESAKLIAYGDPNLQDLVTGVENADGVSAYLNVETPTGTMALKKTSEDGKVEGITFTVTGNGINQTVTTNAAGEIQIDGLTPGVYTVTEQSYEKYEPQSVQRVTVIGGKTTTVTFNNVLKRGELMVTKTSEDSLVEGMKFHLYGTSLSGIAVDEYAVTDSSGKAYFKNVLIGSGYVLEEVDTPVRYVVPASQTACVEWNTVTEKSVANVLKKWNATVTKSDWEAGTPQGNASLAGAVYGVYKGDQLIDTYTTDADGQFVTAYYVCGDDWSIREISPSEGYLLDETSYHVGAEAQLYTVEYNSTANDVTEQVIDEALCIGSNEPQSRLIICAYFMKDHTLEDNAQFLAAHYGENGAGFYVKDRQYALWYNADGILTKSIQRFARNTVDLLETVRHLKDIGVEVRFEKENINSMSGDGELMLSILASFAQEESRSISENVKWGTRKRFEQGIPNGHFQIYGYRWEGDQLVVEPEEAVVVKRIFQNFLGGKSRLETERELEAEGIRTRQGCVMRDSNLKKILTNVTYTGNMLLQKEFIEDPISKKRKQNRGELPQYWVENTHEAIIDLDTFQYVQDEMERRRQLGALANKSLNTTCFTGKIKCPHCNQSYMHNLRTKNGHRQEYWSCGSKKKKKIGDGCPVSGTINHKNLKKACVEVLGITEFDETLFLERVAHIDVPKAYTLVFYMKDGTVIEKACPNTGHQDCWTSEYRARTSAKRRKKPNCRTEFALTGMLKCTECGCNFRRCTQPSATSEDGKFYYWRCAEHGQGCKTIGMREDYLKPQLAKALGEKEWDDAVIREIVDHIDVNTDSLLQIIMKDGSHIDMTFVAPKKICRPKTENEKAHMRRLMKERWTPERKQQMSTYMKNLRKERGDKWRKEK